tara:strand:- start:190 stop:684 length:495 start_codon:yes stop_codon:yes gene_type:complete
MSHSTKFGLSFAFPISVPRNGFPDPPDSSRVPLWRFEGAVAVGQSGCEVWAFGEDSSPGVSVVGAGGECGYPCQIMSVRVSPLFAFFASGLRFAVEFREAFESPATGVGQFAVAACRSPPPFSVLPSFCFRFADSAPPVIVLGVGQDENPLASVGGSHVGRSKA